MKYLLLTIVMLTFLSGCYYDNEEYLYGGIQCDTLQVTYSGTVAGIIQLNCIPCHSTAGNSGNVKLEAYNDIKVHALNGRLMGAISHSPTFAPMPQGAPKLSDCDINKINTWIRSGALNN